MAIDQTASIAENIVIKESLRISFSPDERKIGVSSRLFYDKGFVLHRRCVGENVALLKKDVDYRLIFKVPGLRTANGLYSIYAGVQLLTYEPDGEYFITYRAVGESAIFEGDELREHFEQVSEIHLVSFHALLMASGAAPTFSDLENASVVLRPKTISYTTSAGGLEREAEESQIVQLTANTGAGVGGGADDGISDGGLF